MKYLILVLMFIWSNAFAGDIITANTVEDKDRNIVVPALDNLAKGKVYLANGNLAMVIDVSYAPKDQHETDEQFLSRISASILSNLVLLSQKMEDKKTIDDYLKAMPKPIREKIDYVK